MPTEPVATDAGWGLGRVRDEQSPTESGLGAGEKKNHSSHVKGAFFCVPENKEKRREKKMTLTLSTVTLEIVLLLPHLPFHFL